MGSPKERERAWGPLVHPVSAQGLSLASQLMMQVTLLFFSSRLLANDYVYEVLAENLDHPWGIAVLDNDDLLVTELSGRLRLIKNDYI